MKMKKDDKYIEKVLGTKGVKKGGKPLTDSLYDKTKENRVA